MCLFCKVDHVHTILSRVAKKHDFLGHADTVLYHVIYNTDMLQTFTGTISKL